MSRIFYLFLILNLLNTACVGGPVVGGSAGRLSLHVVDENGTPVGNAQVDGSFYAPRSGGGFSEYTNSDGICVLTGVSFTDVHFAVQKDNYYKTHGTYDFLQQAVLHGYVDPLEEFPPWPMRWEPWNPAFKVLLRKKKNPVPMYNKIVRTLVPIKEKAVGYDLIQADWVAPYGSGLKPDFIITVDGEFRDYDDRAVSLTMTFFNKGDGIQLLENKTTSGYFGKSEFISPYMAPKDGYNPVWRNRRIIAPKIEDRVGLERQPDQVYAFRVRSKTDDNGTITSAFYGKIYGDILFYIKEKQDISIDFSYYLNPDKTRNLEFDTDRNLFQMGRYELPPRKRP